MPTPPTASLANQLSNIAQSSNAGPAVQRLASLAAQQGL
jgi:hypothetical protein